MTDRITQAREALKLIATATASEHQAEYMRGLARTALRQIDSAAPSAAEPVPMTDAEYLQMLRADEAALLAKMRAGTLSLADFSPDLVAAATQAAALLAKQDASPPAPQAASEPVSKVRACIACAMRDAAIAQPPSQEVTPAYLEWLKTKSRSAGVAGNEAWNAGVEWALTQAETSATASGDAEREALIERLKAQSLAHRYEAETDSADLIDETIAALHSTGKPDVEEAPVLAQLRHLLDDLVESQHDGCTTYRIKPGRELMFSNFVGACVRLLDIHPVVAPADAPVAEPVALKEDMVRFCPGCGSVGEVEKKFRDCCPDGSRARLIPEPLARQCRDLFQLALRAATSPVTEEAKDAARDVLAERQRQISAEGWTPEHDDEHDVGELSQAAAFYAMYGLSFERGRVVWPWDESWLKPGSRRRNLVKAGALILAEIERLDRAAVSQGGGT